MVLLFKEIFVLIIIPFSFALILPYSSPIFKLNYPLIYGLYDVKPEWLALIFFLVGSIPGAFIDFIYEKKYRWNRDLSPDISHFIQSEKETTINEYLFLSKIILIEIFIILIITVLYYAIPVSLKNQSIIIQAVLGDHFYWTQFTLSVTIYWIFFLLLPTYVNRNFQFYLARMSMQVVADNSDKLEKFRYLIIALNSYNKYIKRNVKLEFDTAKVYARIISRDDKKEVLNQLLASFEVDFSFEDGKLRPIKVVRSPIKVVKSPFKLVRSKPIDDKLRPISCLSKIANLPSSESFLIQEKLTTSAKEMAKLLATIIPVLIGVLQFILPFFK
jgi:hypothetical protein